VSSNGKISRRILAPARRIAGSGIARPAAATYRDILAAHLVLNLADLRLRKRVQERARRTAPAI
jgi:hypothetical protein